MTDFLSRSERTSPRQALVLVERPSEREWPRDLRLNVLLDLIGSAVGVNGASIFYAPDGDPPEALVQRIPAGINLVARASHDTSSLRLPALRALVARGFTRIVVVASDALGIDPRTLTTALSATASGPVAGRAEGGGIFLIGFAAEAADDVPHAWLSVATWADASAPAGTRVVWMEAAPTLATVASFGALEPIVRERAKHLPRTESWLAARPRGEPDDGS